jgi:glycerol-3-phosphate acyltransferase PlsY
MQILILILACSYLLGSIPFGYILVRIFRGEDVRRSGSGNIGATNVSRKSPGLGVLTLLLDAAKGWAAVEIARHWSPFAEYESRYRELLAAAALFAILGHLFPIWLKFRGGKGVATALGAFISFEPFAVVCSFGIFVVVLLVGRRISLGSLITAGLFPVMVWRFEHEREIRVLASIAVAGALIIVRHHKNIRRLISGEEPRFSLGRK